VQSVQGWGPLLRCVRASQRCAALAMMMCGSVDASGMLAPRVALNWGCFRAQSAPPRGKFMRVLRPQWTRSVYHHLASRLCVSRRAGETAEVGVDGKGRMGGVNSFRGVAPANHHKVKLPLAAEPPYAHDKRSSARWYKNRALKLYRADQ
jgi:hypothetical protein